MGKARHLGEALIQAGLISPAQLDASLRLQSQERSVGTYRRIGQILVESGALTQEQLSQVIASWLGDYIVHPGDRF